MNDLIETLYDLANKADSESFKWSDPADAWFYVGRADGIRQAISEIEKHNEHSL